MNYELTEDGEDRENKNSQKDNLHTKKEQTVEIILEISL